MIDPDLLAKARAMPPMTERQTQEQRLNFAHGNLACTTNHRPHLGAFWALAHRMGWTAEEFIAWAETRRWSND